MKILAFDLGSHMAAATNIDGAIHTLGFKPGTDRRERAMGTMHWLNRLFRELKPLGLEAVIYETPFARGEHATRSLWGLAGIIEACAKSAGFDALDVTPGEIKSWAAGKGNATKEEMIEAAQVMGYAGMDEHEADAYCLLRYAEANVVTETENGRPDGC